jgi:hypothetical protein
MPDGGMLLFPGREHAHLKLAGAVTPGRRKPRASGGGGGRLRFPDRADHARVLREQAVRVKQEFQRRREVLGLRPELVLVLETQRQLRPDDLRPAGLQILELGDTTLMVTFANDPDLQDFLRCNAEYALGTRGLTEKGNERPAKYEALFDTITGVRPLAAGDVLSRASIRL